MNTLNKNEIENTKSKRSKIIGLSLIFFGFVIYLFFVELKILSYLLFCCFLLCCVLPYMLTSKKKQSVSKKIDDHQVSNTV